MSKKYHTLVLIGRFQPVHNAHVEIIRRACELSEQLIIIVGSANQPRTYKNPWTSAEREVMLNEAIGTLGSDNGCKVFIEHNIDTVYNDQAWAIRIQGLVSRYRMLGGKTGIIGHKKDESSFYLNMFPQWELEEVELIEPLNATNIRDLIFKESPNLNFLKGVVPQSTKELLEGFVETTDWEQIIRERKFTESYKQQFASLPYPPVFVTTDAVVICSGHVLMIKRKAEPGKGLWALPGGFLNATTDRGVQDCMIRELREETGIKVPAPVLVGSIQGNRVFDAIDRSSRGRTITHAFKIVLPDGDLPKVKGADDAEKAKWIPIAEVKSDRCFEDHFDIVQWAVGG